MAVRHARCAGPTVHCVPLQHKPSHSTPSIDSNCRYNDAKRSWCDQCRRSSICVACARQWRCVHIVRVPHVAGQSVTTPSQHPGILIICSDTPLTRAMLQSSYSLCIALLLPCRMWHHCIMHWPHLTSTPGPGPAPFPRITHTSLHTIMQCGM